MKKRFAFVLALGLLPGCMHLNPRVIESKSRLNAELAALNPEKASAREGKRYDAFLAKYGELQPFGRYEKELNKLMGLLGKSDDLVLGEEDMLGYLPMYQDRLLSLVQARRAKVKLARDRKEPKAALKELQSADELLKRSAVTPYFLAGQMLENMRLRKALYGDLEKPGKALFVQLAIDSTQDYLGSPQAVADFYQDRAFYHSGFKAMLASEQLLADINLARMTRANEKAMNFINKATQVYNMASSIQSLSSGGVSGMDSLSLGSLGTQMFQAAALAELKQSGVDTASAEFAGALSIAQQLINPDAGPNSAEILRNFSKTVSSEYKAPGIQDLAAELFKKADKAEKLKKAPEAQRKEAAENILSLLGALQGKLDH